MENVATSPDGIPVHYEVIGAGAPALVFVHGWSCDRSYWSRQMPHFARRHKVVAIDLAGHGASGLGRNSWTMEAFGDDVVTVVDQLRLDRIVLIGHSMGGDVIVHSALTLGDRVMGLVWADTYTTLSTPATAEEIEELAAPFRTDFVTTTRDLVRTMFLPTSPAELVEWVVADMSAASPEAAVDALVHSRDNERVIPAALKLLTAPVVAINSDYRPTDAESLQRHGVRTVIMPGVGHFEMMEDPDSFNRLLDQTIEEFGA